MCQCWGEPAMLTHVETHWVRDWTQDCQALLWIEMRFLPQDTLMLRWKTLKELPDLRDLRDLRCTWWHIWEMHDLQWDCWASPPADSMDMYGQLSDDWVMLGQWSRAPAMMLWIGLRTTRRWECKRRALEITEEYTDISDISGTLRCHYITCWTFNEKRLSNGCYDSHRFTTSQWSSWSGPRPTHTPVYPLIAVCTASRANLPMCSWASTCASNAELQNRLEQ